MLKSLSKLFTAKSPSRRQGRALPGFEALEKRDVPASISFNSATGVVAIYGSDHDDVANVAIVNNQVRVSLDCYHTAPPNLGFLSDVEYFTLSSVKEVKFYGYDGKDKFTNGSSIESYADGGEGNDQFGGGTAADYFIGNYGNDIIVGNGGHDTLWGSGGHDTIWGGTGRDLLKGHGGNDVIFGNEDADSLFGGSGDDQLDGNAGMDVIVSIGGGIDTLTGGSQWDNVWMDTTDQMTDPSTNEQTLGYLHKVNQFWKYSYDGGQTSTTVSKELDGQGLTDPKAHDGQLWSDNFKDSPLFASGGPNQEDVLQSTALGDCYFLSRLAAMAQANPESIRKMVVELGDGTYAVRFYRNGAAEYVRVDADFYVTDPSGDELTYAKHGQEGSIWAPIVEKAYAFWRKQQGSYPSINGGNGGTQHVSQDLFGGAINPSITIDDGVTAQQVIDWVASGSPSGSFKTNLTTQVVNKLNGVRDALAEGKAVVVGHKYGVHNGMELVANNWRRGEHITTVDAVLTDASGKPIGIRLRDQYGETNDNGYQNGYVEITDFTRIYFCLGSPAVMTV